MGEQTASRTFSTNSGALLQTNTTRGSTTQSAWWSCSLFPCWSSSPLLSCAATAAAVAMPTAAVAAAAMAPWQLRGQRRRRKRIRPTLRTCGSLSRRGRWRLTGSPWPWCRNLWSWVSWCRGADGASQKCQTHTSLDLRHIVQTNKKDWGTDLVEIRKQCTDSCHFVFMQCRVRKTFSTFCMSFLVCGT